MSDPVSDPVSDSDSDPDSDSNPDPKPNPKKISKKEPYIQAKVRWFHTIIHISHLHVVVRYLYA
jgi:hypothetical protein